MAEATMENFLWTETLVLDTAGRRHQLTSLMFRAFDDTDVAFSTAYSNTVLADGKIRHELAYEVKWMVDDKNNTMAVTLCAEVKKGARRGCSKVKVSNFLGFFYRTVILV
jgi:hypothetical protein